MMSHKWSGNAVPTIVGKDSKSSAEPQGHGLVLVTFRRAKAVDPIEVILGQRRRRASLNVALER